MPKGKILVTGGMGYIGSHTVVELVESNYEVVIVDNLNNSRIEVLDGIENILGQRPVFHELDLQDKSSIDFIVKAYPDLDAIIHFAAHKAVGESVDNPLKYYQNNLLLTINMLELMRKSNAKKIVFSSSCTVYGQPDKLPVDESTEFKKANAPYGHTKQICEAMLQDATHAYDDLKCISLRYFNPIGAHPTSEIGELPSGVPDNLVPFITQTAYGLREELKVFGNDYDTPDGSCIRDYIDVVDLAKAHVVALNRFMEGNSKAAYEVFNLGTGNGVSVLEIIEKFEAATGQKLNYSIVGRRPGDIEKIWSDTEYANEELGWKAEIPLDKTLSSAWNWEQKIRKELTTTT